MPSRCIWVVVVGALVTLSSITFGAAPQGSQDVSVTVIDSEHVAITINNQRIQGTNPGREWTQELIEELLRRVTDPTPGKIKAYLAEVRNLREHDRKALASELIAPVLVELRAQREQAILASDSSSASRVEQRMQLLLQQQEAVRQELAHATNNISQLQLLLSSLDQRATYAAARRDATVGVTLQLLAGAVYQQNAFRPQLGLSLTIGWQVRHNFTIDASIIYRREPSNNGGYKTPTDDSLLEQSGFERAAIDLELAPMFTLLQLRTIELAAGVPLVVGLSKATGNFEQSSWELAVGARGMAFLRLAPEHGIRIGLSVKPTYGFDGTRRYRGFEANYEDERTWTTIAQVEFGYGFMM
jgi:hypothetical protein